MRTVFRYAICVAVAIATAMGAGMEMRAQNQDGDYINNTYSDEEPELLNSGNYRVWRGSSTYVISPGGNRVY